ncbi:MAG: SulP family inorganic anion transporter [Betaproteobacteria bacterium]
MRRRSSAPWLLQLFPFLRWWHMVDRITLRADAIAGLTGGLVLVPQAVAFATIAGMPPEYGLYAAMLPAIVAALWGSSWHLVSGPTTAISIVVFATISPLASPGSSEYIALVLTLTFLVGVFKLSMGLLRLGTLVNFVSHAVVLGFTAGAAVLIAASQVKNFFGIDIARGSSVYRILFALGQQVTQINPWVTTVACLTVLTGVLTRRRWPKAPYLIVAMVVGGMVAALLDLVLGSNRTLIGNVGALSVGFPPLSYPPISPGALEQLAPVAIAVTLLSLTEAIAVARAIAVKSGQVIDANQEFVGQGLSNLTGAFFSGYASSGSFNRSGLNFDSGARTPLAAVFSAVFLLLIVVFLAPLARYLPVPAMAGILFIVAWGLIDFRNIAEVMRVSRQETVVMGVTFLATLTLQLQYAIFIGVLMSLLLFLNRTAKRGIEDVKPLQLYGPTGFANDTGLPDCPQLKIVRINGPIFFGAVNYVAAELRRIDERNPMQRSVLLIGTGIGFVDLEGAHLLAQEARRRRALGGALYVANMKDEPQEMMRRCGTDEVIGAENQFRIGEDVIGQLFPRLDKSICSSCTVRIFGPCKIDTTVETDLAAREPEVAGD